MDVYEFLEKLNGFFPSPDKEDMFKIRVSKYAELLGQTEEDKNKKFDYDKMLNLIIQNYSYKAFPNYTEIVKHCAYLPIENKEPEKEWEFKNYLVTTEGGHQYQFVLVPDSYGASHKLSEFENCVEITPPFDYKKIYTDEDLKAPDWENGFTVPLPKRE